MKTHKIVGSVEMPLVPPMYRRWFDEHQDALVYVAAPMFGQPDHGHSALRMAEMVLRHYGLVVMSPREGSPDVWAIGRHNKKYPGDFRQTPMYQKMIKRDLYYVLQAEAIFMLPGWRDSTGASLEYVVAGITGVTVFDGAWILATNDDS